MERSSAVHRGLPGIHGIAIQVATVPTMGRLMFWQMSDQYPHPSAAMLMAMTEPIVALRISIFTPVLKRIARSRSALCWMERLLNKKIEAEAIVSQSKRGSL
jgi:hypothetical protein